MLLSAVTFLRHRQGIYPIAILNFETQEITIYTENGKETLKFDNIKNIQIDTNIPVLVTPN